MRYNYPEYETMDFSQIFPTFEEFKEYIANSPFYTTDFQTKFTDENLKLNYMLLFNKYGFSPIALMSVDHFKSKLVGIMWQYGLTFIQKLEIQNKLRSLGIEDTSEIYKGSAAIYNHAYNPETAPATSDTEELSYINDQNTTKYKRSRLEGLSQLLDLLNDSFIDDYLNKFRKLFKIFVSPEVISYVGVDEV